MDEWCKNYRFKWKQKEKKEKPSVGRKGVLAWGAYGGMKLGGYIFYFIHYVHIHSGCSKVHNEIWSSLSIIAGAAISMYNLLQIITNYWKIITN